MTFCNVIRFSVAAILLCMAATSCQIGDRSFEMLSGQCATDSMSFVITDTVSVLIGDEIQPYPYYNTMSVTSGGKDIYLILDDRNIYCFDLDSLSLMAYYKDWTSSKLSSLSGIRYSDNLMWIYNYKEHFVAGYDHNYKMLEFYHFDNEDLKIDPWIMPDNPMIVTKEYIYLSGVPMVNPYCVDSLPSTMAINRQDGSIIQGGLRPSPYFVNNSYFGIDNLWRTYQNIGANSDIVISYPLSSTVEIYTSALQQKSSFYMGSRYAPRKQPMAVRDINNESLDREYYLGLHSYKGVLYDSCRCVYYRIATHPLLEYDVKRPTIKPFSIIVCDISGNLLTETPIIYEGSKYLYDRVFVGKRGLYMQIESEDENIIKFVVFNQKRSNNVE